MTWTDVTETRLYVALPEAHSLSPQALRGLYEEAWVRHGKADWEALVNDVRRAILRNRLAGDFV